MKTLLISVFCILISCTGIAVAAESAPAVLPNVTYTASEVINIWPGTAPGETGDIGPEYVLPNRPRPFDQIADVSVPTLSVFLPDEAKRTGTAILVIPGGGLQRLAIEHEGYEVAEWLNDRGIAAFLLKYRVPPRDPERRWKVGLQDAQRAMSILRSRADEWGVYQDSIGTIGFSAGGEINVMLSVYTGERQYEPVDAVDAYPTHPDFNIPIYGGGFVDYRNNKLRDDILTRINENTPPMFIVHAFDDGALSSIILMNALKRKRVVSELHIFGAGAHGFGFRESGLPVNNWRQLLVNWLEWQGYMDAPAIRDYATNFTESRSGNTDTLPRFESTNKKASVEEAFAAQHRIVRSVLDAGGKVAGYKGVFTSEASQSAFNVTEPVHGVLFEAGKLEYDGTAPVAVSLDTPMLVETEIGYVMETNIGTKLTVARQAMTTVRAIVPVIELPNNLGASMNGTLTSADVAAANAASNRFIVGAAIDPKTIDNIDEISVSLARNGSQLHVGKGSDAIGGQAANLMILINKIIDQGHVIHAGDIIVSGALGAVRPVESGNYSADFGMLGRIEFSVE